MALNVFNKPQKVWAIDKTTLVVYQTTALGRNDQLQDLCVKQDGSDVEYLDPGWTWNKEEEALQWSNKELRKRLGTP